MIMLGMSKGDRQVIIQAEFLYTKGRWKMEQNSKVHGRSKQLHTYFCHKGNRVIHWVGNGLQESAGIHNVLAAHGG